MDKLRPLDSEFRKRTAALALCFSLIGGCSIPSLPSGGHSQAGSNSSVRAQAAPVANSPEARQCIASLGVAGARFTPLPDRYYDSGCSTLDTVQLFALPGEGTQLEVGNIGPVTCPVSSAFAAWARFGVDRAARQILGSPVASIQTMGSYSCRNVAGSNRRSGHASAAAIDVAAFVLQDGRRISVATGWQGSRAEQQFLRTVQASACRRFATVLGPEYNAAHRDHFHVEGVISGNSYCR